MYGPRLNRLLNLKNIMHSEAFLKLLARKNAASGHSVGVTSGNEPLVDSGSASMVNAGLLKEKERKRHRDGGNSRHHHHKRNKDSSKVVVVEDNDIVTKEGVVSQDAEVKKTKESIEEIGGIGSIVKASPAFDSLTVRLQKLSLCKDYAAKVIFA